MKQTNTVLFFALLIGILIGSGLGYILAGVKTVQAESNRGMLNDFPGKVSQPMAMKRDEPKLVAGVAESVRVLPTKAPTPIVSEVEVDSLVSGVQVHATPRFKGDGAIVGRVVDTDGQSLVGVVMRLTARPDRNEAPSPAQVGQAAPEMPSLKEAVREAAQEYQDRRGLTYETKTDERGEYRFEDLENLSWTVTGYLADFEIKPDAARGRARVGAEVNFTAQPVSQFPVMVTLPDGSQPALADIRVKQMGQGNPQRNYAWSPREPFLRLAPGRFEIRAYSHDERGTEMADLASESVKIGVKASTPPESIQLSLEPRLGITGYILLAKSEPTENNYMVRILELAAEQELDLELLAKSDHRDWSQPGSLFSFTDLKPGRYAVGASRGWNGPIIVHELVDLTDSIVDIRLTLPEVDLSEVLRAVVLSADGEPLDDVNFQFEQSSDGSSSSSGVQTNRDADGAYILTLDSDEQSMYFGKEVSSMKFTLKATHKEWGAQEVDLSRGQTEVNILFEVPGSLTVSVPGYSGSGYEGRLRIHANKKVEDNNRRYFGRGGQEKVDAEGLRKFEGLTPGLYVISLVVEPEGSSRNNWYGGRTVNTAEIDIRAGENSMALALPALFNLRVHWSEGKEGQSLYLTAKNGEGESFGMNGAEFDASGIATWNDLSAGEYSLNFYDGESRMMVISVPCGEVEFTPMEINAMRITIDDPKGDLAMAGFRSGDLIIGADEKEFEAQSDMNAIWAKLQSKSAEVDFIVRRNNVQITIHVTGAAMNGWNAMGGSFEPTTR